MSNSLKHIFAQPEYISGIGNVYPIKLKDYDKFQECSKLLYISKNNFIESDLPLLGLIFMCIEQLGISEKDLILSFEKLFSLVLKKAVRLKTNGDIFRFEIIPKNKNINDDCEDNDSEKTNDNYKINKIIDFSNYDAFRSVVMKQNLIFEQKIYKNKLVQEWANKVLESRSKNSPKITMEDFITTVKNYDGLTYEQIMNQTIYQLYADFYRIGKFKQFDQSNLFATVSTEKISIEHFAQAIDMFKSPYDDLFVDSSKLNKFSGIAK